MRVAKEKHIYSQHNSAVVKLITLLVLLCCLICQTSKGQCDGSGNDEWIFGHVSSAQITYSHLWVDPAQFDVFLAGFTTNPKALENTLSASVTKAGILEYYREEDNLGEVRSAHLISQVGLNGVSHPVSGFVALNGVVGQPKGVFILELTSSPSLVFGTWLPENDSVTLFTIQALSDVTNWGCSFTPPKLSVHDTANIYYGFESCDLTDAKQYVVSFNLSPDPPTYNYASLDSSSFTGVSRRLEAIHTSPTVNAWAHLLFRSINNGSHALIIENHPSASLGQSNQSILLPLTFTVNVNGSAQAINLWKPVAFHVYVADQKNALIIMEKIDQDSELVFIRNTFDSLFTSLQQYSASAMGGSYIATLTRMVHLSSFVDNQEATVLFKDLQTGRIYLINQLDLETNTMVSFLEITSQITGLSPLLTGQFNLFNAPSQVRAAVDGSNVQIFQLGADRVIRSVDLSKSACYRFTMVTPTGYASPTWNSTLFFIGGVSPAYTLFASNYGQAVTLLDPAQGDLITAKFLITTALQPFRLYNPCMIRQVTPIEDQLYELQLGTQTFTHDGGHTWLDACRNGQSMNPDSPRIWLLKMVDSSNNELNAPFSYFYPKIGSLDTLVVDTDSLTIPTGTFTVHYRASYEDSVSLDEAFYSDTFTLIIAQQSTCDNKIFNLPLNSSYDYGVVPLTPTATEFHLSLPYDNDGCHFYLEPKFLITPTWFGMTDQVLTQEFNGGIWKWTTSQAAVFTVTSSDLSLVGQMRKVPIKMMTSFGKELKTFDLDFYFKEKCVPNLQLTPFSAETVQLGASKILQITNGSNGNCQFSYIISNSDDTSYDPNIFSESVAQFQLQTDSIDIYTITVQQSLTISTSNQLHLGNYSLKFKILNAQGNLERQELLTITINQSCQTNSVNTNFSQTSFTYQIDSQTINLQNLSLPLDNNSCGFSTSLTYTASGLPVDKSPTVATFLFSEAQLSPDNNVAFQTGYFIVNSDALLQIGTTDVNKVGQYQFTLTVNSEQDPTDTRSYDFAFTVNLEYTCTESFTYPQFEKFLYKIDTVNAISSTYTLDPIWNGNCDFSVQLTSIVRLDGQAANNSLFVFSPPTLQPVVGSPDNTVTKLSDASISIQTSDATAQAEYALTFTIFSHALLASGSLSSATQVFSKQFNLKQVCTTSGFTMPQALQPTPLYVIGQPNLSIDLSTLSNGNCLFTATMTNQNASLAGIGFTFSPHTQALDSGSIDVYVTTQAASLQIQTNDLTIAQTGQLSLLLTAVDANNVSLTDSVIILVDVKFDCTSTGITMPASISPIRYRVDATSPIAQSFSLGPISNSLCFFSTSLLDNNGNQLGLLGQFTFNEVDLTPQASPTIANQYLVAQDPSLTISSSNLAHLGYYSAILMATNQSNTLNGSLPISIELYSNPCVGSLTSIPTTVSLTTQIQLQNQISTTNLISLGPISNGECLFDLELSMIDSSALNTDLFKVIQPQFAMKAGQNESQILDVITDGIVQVEPVNYLNIGTYDLSLTVKSMKETYDIAFVQVTFQVIIAPCDVSNLDPTLLSFGLQAEVIYTQYDSTVSILVENKISCAETQLLIVSDQTNNSLDEDIFLTAVNTQQRSTVLQIQTDNVKKVGDYTITVREVDLSSGQTFIEETIAVKVLDFCKGASLKASSLSNQIFFAGQQPKKIAWDSFEISSAHKVKCFPVSYTVQMQTLQGAANESWFIKSPERQEIEIGVPEISEDMLIKFSIIGQIQGNSQYASATMEFQLLIKGTGIQIETTPLEQPDVEENPSSNTNDENQNIQQRDKLIKDLESVFDFTYEPEIKITKTIKERLQAPKGIIQSISNTGVVTVNFDKPLFVQNYFKNTEKKQGTPGYIDLSTDLIQLDVISDSDYILEENPQAFATKSIKMMSFEPTQILFQLEFVNPKLISKDRANLDQLQLTFRGEIPLIDSQDGLKIKIGQQTIDSIPPQLTQDEVKELEEFGEQVASSTNLLASSNLVINIALSQTLKFVWGLVNLLQMAIFLPEWLIGFSEQSQVLLKYLKSLAFLEFFDAKEGLDSFTTQINELAEQYLKVEDQTNSEEKQYRNLRLLQEIQTSIETSSKIEEDVVVVKQESPDLMGKAAIMIILALILGLLLLLLICIKPIIYCDYRIYKAYRLLKQRIFYNAFIRYVLQSSLKLQMAAASCLYIIQTASFTIQDNKDTSQISLEGILSWAIIGVALLMPIFFGLILYKNFENLAYPSYKKKFGSMYEGCKTESVAALLYSIIFLYRRIAFVAATYLLRQYPSLQVSLLVHLNLAYLCYLVHQKPLADKLQLNLEISNEMMFGVVCTLLFWMQDPFAGSETRQSMGKSMNYLILTMITVTFTTVLGQVALKAVLYCKTRCAQRSQRQKIDEKRKNMAKQNLFEVKNQLIVEEEKKSELIYSPKLLLTTNQPFRETSNVMRESVETLRDNSHNFDQFKYSVAASHNLITSQEKRQGIIDEGKPARLLNPAQDTYLLKKLEERPTEIQRESDKGSCLAMQTEIDKIGAKFAQPYTLPKFFMTKSQSLQNAFDQLETSQGLQGQDEKEIDTIKDTLTLPPRLEAKFISFQQISKRKELSRENLKSPNISVPDCEKKGQSDGLRESNNIYQEKFQSLIMQKIHRQV